MNTKKRDPILVFDIPLVQFVLLVIAAAVVLVLFVFQVWWATTINQTAGRADTTQADPFDTLPRRPIDDIHVTFGGSEWRILVVQGSRMLLLSEQVLFTRAFHDSYEPANWETSDIRRYLNSDFLHTFSAEERERIVQTQADAINDYVFLLSVDEIVTHLRGTVREELNGADIWRITDENNIHRIAFDASGRYRWWWTRSAGMTDTTTVNVGLSGYILLDGFPVVEEGGIRPAMWVIVE